MTKSSHYNDAPLANTASSIALTSVWTSECCAYKRYFSNPSTDVSNRFHSVSLSPLVKTPTAWIAAGSSFSVRRIRRRCTRHSSCCYYARQETSAYSAGSVNRVVVMLTFSFTKELSNATTQKRYPTSDCKETKKASFVLVLKMNIYYRILLGYTHQLIYIHKTIRWHSW